MSHDADVNSHDFGATKQLLLIVWQIIQLCYINIYVCVRMCIQTSGFAPVIQNNIDYMSYSTIYQ